MKSALLCAVVAFSTLVGCVDPFSDDVAPSPSAQLRESSIEEQAFLELINQLRAEHGAPPLVASPLLNQVAYDHSLDMGQQDYFDHTNLEGESPFDRMRAAGYSGGAMAENIAAGGSRAQDAFDQWRSSPGHFANMINPKYRAIGIGRAVVEGSAYETYWTTVFGDLAR
jgi:uncharacterized protein YkwD